MKNLLKVDLRRGLLNKYMIFSIIGCVIAGILGMNSIYNQLNLGNRIDGGITSFYFAQSGSTSVIYLLLIPLFVALPFSSAIRDDIKSGFYMHFIPRCGVKKYILSKIIVSLLVGIIIVSISTFLLYIGCYLVYLPTGTELINFTENQVMYYKLGGTYLLLGVLNGGLWAIIASLLSIVLKNKYTGWGAPFIMNYILVSFQERYYEKAIYLNPQEWAAPIMTLAWLDGIILISLWLIVGGISFTYLKRRVL